MKAIRLFVFVVALIATPAAVPQELTQYRVELIILRHLNPAYGSEIWPAPEPTRLSDIPAERFPAIPADDLNLTKMSGRLANSKSYRVISHSGWTQPGYSREDARRKVLLRNARTGERVSGSVAVTRERYLRMELDLVLDLDGASYQLKSARRLISRQANYFDHPHFGVIAIIEPL